jgi:hypothetical protein
VDEIGETCSMHGTDEKCIKSIVKNPEEKRPLGDIGVNVSMILKRILGKYGIKLWIGFKWLGVGHNDGFL